MSRRDREVLYKATVKAAAKLLIRLSIETHCMFDGDAEHIQLWLTGYNTGINAVPIEEITRSDGLRKVVDYLDSVSMH